MWRPRNWVLQKPIAITLQDIKQDEWGEARLLTNTEKEIFEAGADAILQLLKVVVIPNEESNDKETDQETNISS